MPISLKDFKAGNFNKRATNDRTKHPIILFLKKEKRAYTVKEICKAVKTKEDTIRGMLRILVKVKLVEHKAPFFALKR